MRNLLIYLLITTMLFACGGKKQQKQSENEEQGEVSLVIDSGSYTLAANLDILNEKKLPQLINFDQNIDQMSYQELKIWLYYVYAIHGLHIMEADINGFFTANTDWYQRLVWDLWEKDEMPEEYSDITLSEEEQLFVDKIKKRMNELQKENFSPQGIHLLGNVNNIANLFQYKNTDEQFYKKLAENNFIISRGKNIQLFHLYEENDYKQLPNFITTDLYLQAFHMYFSYTLKSIEQEKLIPILTDLCLKMYNKSKALIHSNDNEIKKLAEFNTTFYAIPYFLLTQKELALSERQKKFFDVEISKINQEEDDLSEFLNWTEVFFSYSLFKPRGHYTRNSEMQQYFKAMMWLQTAPFCLDEREKLNQSVFSGYLLTDKELYKSYQSIYEPIAFLVGLPDNLSFMDITDFIHGKQQINSIEEAFTTENINKIEENLKILAKTRNKIKPEIEISCVDKINFMPQRYLIDSDIIQKMVDVGSNSERAYPRALDLFSTFGVKSAEDILTKTYRDQEKWELFTTRLNENKTKFQHFNDWNKSVYNKWIKSLIELQKTDKQYPEFMQTAAWSLKNLNTALASWAELKHDAILYGEQPMAAECGGGGPPTPIVKGYVEPNLKFWNELAELLILTKNVLAKNGLLTEDLKAKNEQLADYVKFLIQVSKKELANEVLDDNEYFTIEYMGSSIEYFTLSVIEPGLYMDEWSQVKGPDKSIAVVADIYTRNVPECNKNGILHVATGNVNSIYVVVPIGKELYLTKGATFSYYEFVEPLGTRLTDEEWQKRLDEGKIPKEEEWMKDIIIGTEPEVEERVFYSSGC